MLKRIEQRIYCCLNTLLLKNSMTMPGIVKSIASNPTNTLKPTFALVLLWKTKTTRWGLLLLVDNGKVHIVDYDKKDVVY